MGIFRLGDGVRFDGLKWLPTPMYLFIPGYDGYELYYTGRDKRGKKFSLHLYSTKFEAAAKARKKLERRGSRKMSEVQNRMLEKMSRKHNMYSMDSSYTDKDGDIVSTKLYMFLPNDEPKVTLYQKINGVITPLVFKRVYFEGDEQEEREEKE